LYSREFLGSETVLSVDLLEAKFPSEIFDVIYMRDLIQHIPTPKAFLMECRRIAKPDCTIFIGTHNIEGFVAKAVKSRYTPIFGFMEPCHFSPRTITKILKQTGFTVREIQFESLDCTIGEVISHFASPTFTTIFPAEIGRAQYFVLRLLLALLVRTPLRYLDNLITPKISNWLKQGSWMNVLAEKNIP
jgi:SAM-dependent methyltransferase